MIAAVIALLAVVAFAYRDAPDNTFHFDDRVNIHDNPSVRVEDLRIDSLWRAATEGLLASRGFAYVTLAVDWWRGGGDPRPFQWTNLAIHGLTAVSVLLLFSLALRSSREPMTRTVLASAWIGAALWAAHPIQIQAVTYIVQRMASLATLFTVLAVALYVSGRRSTRPRVRLAKFGIAAFCAVCGFFSKETAWILPALIVIAEIGLVRQRTQSLLSRWERTALLVLVIAGAALFVLTCLEIGPLADRFLPGYSRRDFSMTERLMTQPRVVLYHLSQILWPHPGRFGLEHDFTVSVALWRPWTTLPAILAVGAWCAAASAILVRTRHRAAGFFLLWVPLTLVIESSFVPLEMIFEHRLYLPSVGLFGIASLACARLWRVQDARLRQFAGLAVAVVMVLLVSVTGTLVPTWRSKLSRTTQDVRVAPNSERAWAEHGLALIGERRPEEARAAFLRSLELDPDNGQAMEYLGVLELDEGDLEEAKRWLYRAMMGGRGGTSVLNHLGEVHLAGGDFSEAERHFRAAIWTKPWVPVYRYNLAVTLERDGRCAEAYRAWGDYLSMKDDEARQAAARTHIQETYRAQSGRCFVGVTDPPAN